MKTPISYRYSDLLIDKSRYHGNCKKLEKKSLYKKAKRGKSLHRIYNLYCAKHKVDCSRTGWEWHWYGGTYSKVLK